MSIHLQSMPFRGRFVPQGVVPHPYNLAFPNLAAWLTHETMACEPSLSTISCSCCLATRRLSDILKATRKGRLAMLLACDGKGLRWCPLFCTRDTAKSTSCQYFQCETWQSNDVNIIPGVDDDCPLVFQDSW